MSSSRSRSALCFSAVLSLLRTFGDSDCFSHFRFTFLLAFLRSKKLSDWSWIDNSKKRPFRLEFEAKLLARQSTTG